MKHFLKLVLFVSVIYFSYGFISPLLISYPDTFLVLFGFLNTFVLTPVVLYYIIKPYIDYIKYKYYY
jgi:hypothetical protein